MHTSERWSHLLELERSIYEWTQGDLVLEDGLQGFLTEWAINHDFSAIVDPLPGVLAAAPGEEGDRG